MKAYLEKTIYVEAAHRNPAGGPPQQRLHGHSYRIELLSEGEVDPGLGWIVDYRDLKQLFKPIEDRLDHAYLNEVPGLEEDTTLPAVQRWINAQLAARQKDAVVLCTGVRVSILGDLCFRPVHVPATPRHPDRWRFTFEAAQSLPRLPQGHPCRNVHGHSYQIEAGAEDIDGLVSHLEALYGLFDHRHLNDVQGLEHATCECMCGWIWHWLQDRGQKPTVIIVRETPSARCIYYGE